LAYGPGNFDTPRKVKIEIKLRNPARSVSGWGKKRLDLADIETDYWQGPATFRE
jgi:hypothetical protein